MNQPTGATAHDARSIDYDRGRVLLAPSGTPAPFAVAGSVTVTGGLALAYDAAYRRVDVIGADGAPVATLIGHPYLPDAGFLADGAVHRLTAACASLADLEDTLLARLAGNFLLVTQGVLAPRVYLDGAGSMPLVYMPERRMAATTANVILSPADYTERFETAHHKAMILDEGIGGWIPGYETAHRGLRRLLPNHALDLESWDAVRHWPNARGVQPWTDPAAAMDEITGLVRRFCEGAAAAWPLYAALTAGRDTRFILAACRSFAATTDWFTVATGLDPMDVDVAETLARRHGLSHHTLALAVATPAQQDAWDHAVGHVIVEHNRANHPTLLATPDDCVIMSGLFGEMGSCRYYTNDHATVNERPLTVASLVKRLALPETDRAVAAMAEWFAPISHLPPSSVLDLALWEIKEGGWSMAQRPAQGAIRLHLIPIAQRRVLELFTMMDPKVKDGPAFYIACIAAMWPELLAVPINRFGDYRDVTTKLRKLVTPGRLKRYLRARLAARG